jgi:tRNA A37 N6-isopentenylltransferase MiaA
LPREEAEHQVVLATSRLAAYQRKWLRRLPGVTVIPANRPPGEIAADVVELAAARGHTR